jgi:arylsulfatase A-like enzyme
MRTLSVLLLVPVCATAVVAVLNACWRPVSPASTAGCAGCNVLLITLDTVRADHLPCYGYGIDTAPNLCGLAEEGALFTNAISQSAWTLAAHASILTGLYPFQHGAENGSTPIEDDAPRLARIMRRNHYTTGAIVSSRFVNASYGFKRGFQYFDDSPDQRGNDNTYARKVTDKALSWLDEQSDPFFLWLHFFDPHHAYLHHDSGFDYVFEPAGGFAVDYTGWNQHPSPLLDFVRENRETLVSLYDGEIYHTDQQIGRLLQHLRQTDRFDRTMVIVTSDHGEAFGDHDHVGHGKLLYQELIRVPLIVRIPGYSERRVVDGFQETKDIFHTVLSVLGIDAQAGSGFNLLSDSRSYIYSEVNHKIPDKRVAVIHENWKMNYTFDGTVELFDLSEDPKEQINVAEENTEIVRNLLERMSEDMNVVVMDEEALEDLRSLGYIH